MMWIWRSDAIASMPSDAPCSTIVATSAGLFTAGGTGSTRKACARASSSSIKCGWNGWIAVRRSGGVNAGRFRRTLTDSSRLRGRSTSQGWAQAISRSISARNSAGRQRPRARRRCGEAGTFERCQARSSAAPASASISHAVGSRRPPPVSRRSRRSCGVRGTGTSGRPLATISTANHSAFGAQVQAAQRTERAGRDLGVHADLGVSSAVAASASQCLARYASWNSRGTGCARARQSPAGAVGLGEARRERPRARSRRRSQRRRLLGRLTAPLPGPWLATPYGPKDGRDCRDMRGPAAAMRAWAA